MFDASLEYHSITKNKVENIGLLVVLDDLWNCLYLFYFCCCYFFFHFFLCHTTEAQLTYRAEFLISTGKVIEDVQKLIGLRISRESSCGPLAMALISQLSYSV